MIEPGAIYKTVSGWYLVAVELEEVKDNYSLWKTHKLNWDAGEGQRTVLVEDYWLENLERVA